MIRSSSHDPLHTAVKFPAVLSANMLYVPILSLNGCGLLRKPPVTSRFPVIAGRNWDKGGGAGSRGNVFGESGVSPFGWRWKTFTCRVGSSQDDERVSRQIGKPHHV